MAIRNESYCKGPVLWLKGRQVTIRGQYCGYKECNLLSGACTVAIRNDTDS